jgi:hypothetical protein
VNDLERSDIEGDIPVTEIYDGPSVSPSTTEHEKLGGKQGGPSPKAKYQLATDSV